jgi:hypothetical protein
MVDDRRWEPVPAINRFRLRHRIMLREHPRQRDSAQTVCVRCVTFFALTRSICDFCDFHKRQRT